MKNKLIYMALSSAILLGNVGCNDGFMDRYPEKDIVINDYWTSEDDLAVYTNGFYETLAQRNEYMAAAYGNTGWESFTKSLITYAGKTDDYASRAEQHKPWVLMGMGIDAVPTDATVDTWDFTFLYQINYFLKNYEKDPTLKNVSDKYKGEALFFRAWDYLSKVQQFGDVPWLDKVLDENSPELYGGRTPRKEVMAHVLDDINEAIKKLPEVWDRKASKHRVTRWTALGLKSRICLYEGTYRKYHNLGDEQLFLEEAFKAAEELIDKGPYKLYTTGKPKEDLRQLFLQDDLGGNPEVLMRREYMLPNLGHHIGRYSIRTSLSGLTRSLVDDFLCIESDGTAKPIALSSIYNEVTAEDLFLNRDPRLAQTVLDPRDASTVLGYNFEPKQFPKLNGTSGNAQSLTGYLLVKFYSYEEDKKGQDNSTIDYPLMRYAEVLLNYAEAAAELGKDPSTFLPKSINKLRERAGMPAMENNPPMDPRYASDGVSSLIVEIRRERRIELAMENFRYQDLMRWKQGKKLAEPVYGIPVSEADFAPGGKHKDSKIPRRIDSRNGKLYVVPYDGELANENRRFDENKNYLRPIPINVMAKNPNLRPNNPGWN